MVLVSGATAKMKGQGKHLMVMVPLGMMQSAGLRVNIYPQALWEKGQKKEKIDESLLYQLKMNFTLCHQRAARLR